jgi:hypothetical protein
MIRRSLKMNVNPELEDTLISSLIAGAALCAVCFIYGFIKAWVSDILDTQAALDEIESTNYFPRIRVYPEIIKRFAAIHNARILDMLDLGVEPDSGDHYYYLHITQPGAACASMLIKRGGDNTISLMHHRENRVAQALVNKCSDYVHDTAVTSLMIMFATRIMNSDMPSEGNSPFGHYSKTTLDSTGRIVFDTTSETSESED